MPELTFKKVTRQGLHPTECVNPLSPTEADRREAHERAEREERNRNTDGLRAGYPQPTR